MAENPYLRRIFSGQKDLLDNILVIGDDQSVFSGASPKVGVTSAFLF
jgi:hypothetical protein